MLVFLTFLDFKDDEEKLHCLSGYCEQVETALVLWKQAYEINPITNTQVCYPRRGLPRLAHGFQMPVYCCYWQRTFLHHRNQICL